MLVLEYALGRETPVGPPWITTRSGYLRPAWKPTGLCRPPSTSAPSWLFHEITSSALAGQPATCFVMSVSLRGFSAVAIGATYSSPSVEASDAVNAVHWPSGVMLKPDPIHLSDGVYRLIARVAGSML